MKSTIFEFLVKKNELFSIFVTNVLLNFYSWINFYCCFGNSLKNWKDKCSFDIIRLIHSQWIMLTRNIIIYCAQSDFHGFPQNVARAFQASDPAARCLHWWHLPITMTLLTFGYGHKINSSSLKRSANLLWDLGLSFLGGEICSLHFSDLNA